MPAALPCVQSICSRDTPELLHHTHNPIFFLRLLPRAERTTLRQALEAPTCCLPLSDLAISRLFSFLGPFARSWILGNSLGFGSDLEMGLLIGTQARWCWATGGWSNSDRMEAQPSSEFHAAGKYAADKDALFGGSHARGKGSLHSPSASAREKLGLAAMWNAFGPEKQQRELWLCRSFGARAWRGFRVPVVKLWKCQVLT